MSDGAEDLERLLELAGITILPEDKEPMTRLYATVLEQRKLLYGVEAVRYEEPDLIFSAKL